MNKESSVIKGVILEYEDKELNESPEVIDEVFIQKNVIEKVEIKIQNLEKEKEKYPENTQKRFFPSFLIINIIVLLVGTTILSYILGSVVGNPSLFLSTVDTVFGPLKRSTLLTGISVVALLPGLIILQYIEYKDSKNAQRKRIEIQNEITFLKKELEKEKEVLKTLEKGKQKEQQDEKSKIGKTDAIQMLNAIKKDLFPYDDLEYNDQKDSEYSQEEKNLILKKDS